MIPIAGAPPLSSVDIDSPVLAYQPIVALPSQRLWAIEGLFRPIAGDPAAALAAAGATRSHLERQIVAAAFDDAAAWCRRRRAVLSVNISTEVAAEPATATLLARLLDEHRLVPGDVWVELRSSAEPQLALLPGLQALADVGTSLVLDGLGLAEEGLDVARLHHHLPVAGLKVRLAGSSPRALAAAGRFAEERGIPLLVNDVETETDLEAATLLGAAAAQGYWFGHPVPLERLAVDG
jgi:EAL domain-containing protein (putative c-di-GMP-specific phosphodiesterase class I)